MQTQQLFNELKKKLESGEIILRTDGRQGSQDFVLLCQETKQQLKIGQWEMKHEGGCHMVRPLPYDKDWNE